MQLFFFFFFIFVFSSYPSFFPCELAFAENKLAKLLSMLREA
jgi:hypothetical protein